MHCPFSPFLHVESTSWCSPQATTTLVLEVKAATGRNFFGSTSRVKSLGSLEIGMYPLVICHILCSWDVPVEIVVFHYGLWYLYVLITYNYSIPGAYKPTYTFRLFVT